MSDLPFGNSRLLPRCSAGWLEALRLPAQCPTLTDMTRFASPTSGSPTRLRYALKDTRFVPSEELSPSHLLGRHGAPFANTMYDPVDPSLVRAASPSFGVPTTRLAMASHQQSAWLKAPRATHCCTFGTESRTSWNFRLGRQLGGGTAFERRLEEHLKREIARGTFARTPASHRPTSTRMRSTISLGSIGARTYFGATSPRASDAPSTADPESPVHECGRLLPAATSSTAFEPRGSPRRSTASDLRSKLSHIHSASQIVPELGGRPVSRFGPGYGMPCAPRFPGVAALPQDVLHSELEKGRGYPPVVLTLSESGRPRRFAEHMFQPAGAGA